MRRNKKYLFFTIELIVVLLIFNIKIFSNDKISENRKKYIVENLKSKVKYKVSDNIEMFKKIFIGWWNAPPHADYIFFDNGVFITNNIDLNYKNKIGNWFLKNDILYLKFKEDKKWNLYKINYYLLEFGIDMLGNKLNYYNLYIELDKSIKWDCVSEFVLQFQVDERNI